MIITITGKPCSGKGTVSKEFCKKYNFEYIGTGITIDKEGYNIISPENQVKSMEKQKKPSIR